MEAIQIKINMNYVFLMINVNYFKCNKMKLWVWFNKDSNKIIVSKA